MQIRRRTPSLIVLYTAPELSRERSVLLGRLHLLVCGGGQGGRGREEERQGEREAERTEGRNLNTSSSSSTESIPRPIPPFLLTEKMMGSDIPRECNMECREDWG
jgi:hypothetical protein